MVLNCFECIRNREKKNDGLTNPFRSIFSSISNRLKIFNNCEKIKLTVKLEMENEPLNCSIDSIADNVNVNYRNVFNTCIHEINEKSLNTSIFQHKTIERGKSRDLCNESVHNRLHKNTIKLLEVINLNGLKEVESEKNISNKNFMFFKKSKPKRFSYPKVLINNIPCFYSEIQSYHNRSKFNNPPKMTVYPTRRHSLPINIKKIAFSMSNSSDMAPLYEAHAILSNLIDETEKEFQFNSTLKSVLSLIEAFESSFSINSHNSLAPIGTNNRRKSVVAGMNPNFLNDMQNPVNLQNKIANLPYTSKIESQISNDNINPSLMRNMHITQTLSTTTSAVGTPTPAMAFKRNRSKSIIYQIPVNRLKYMNKIIPINKITYDGNNSKNQNNGKNDFITPLASIQYIKNQYYTDPISKEKLELFMKENPEINQINRIEFDIFSYCSTSNEYVLSSVIYKIFQKLNFFNTFNIPTDKFINYFHDLEYNYGNNHYHNRMHAADVTQVIYYFISNELPSIDSNESKSYVFSPIELMSLITAAAQHDFNHPGKTNAFMVATQSPLAILYNDRSVLEFHHAAESWNLYLSNEKYSWLENLSDTDFKKFRFLSTEAILSTDLKRHFEIIAQFSSKDVVDWNSEVDRMMISNMLIKMADISGPTKPLNTHTHWTNLICKEFYDQGDEEEKLGLSISTYMDKNNPQLALLQYNFINNLVLPLCHTLSTFGLLPGYSVNKNDETIIKVKVMDYLNDNMNFWKLKLESKKSK